MKELSVGKIIISKQGEESENYQKFKELIKDRKIKVQVVNKGDRLQIERNLYFDILWPNNSKLMSENVLNNNSIVCKLHYKNFSMLFTGDIELKATIIKVPHHGSKTSSTHEFLEAVNSSFALIGVGRNNTFGHPNDEVIERLKSLRYKNIQN